MEKNATQTLATQEDLCLQRIVKIYRELLFHDGFGDLAVEVKLLKRGQKEVIIKSGKQYRYVVDIPEKALHKD